MATRQVFQGEIILPDFLDQDWEFFPRKSREIKVVAGKRPKSGNGKIHYDTLICTLPEYETETQEFDSMANARLIAHAPDMIRILSILGCECQRGNACIPDELMNAIQTIIIDIGGYSDGNNFLVSYENKDCDCGECNRGGCRKDEKHRKNDKRNDREKRQ